MANKRKAGAVMVGIKDSGLLEESADILSDSRTMKVIKKGKQQIKDEKLVDWKDLKAKLNL